ncbi:MAG: hypothetical protein M5R36_12030 [Deltaproteobacteria bacterium]|nr:hypothetical protein [Deltaproteobacteria bacterium]
MATDRQTDTGFIHRAGVATTHVLARIQLLFEKSWGPYRVLILAALNAVLAAKLLSFVNEFVIPGFDRVMNAGDQRLGLALIYFDVLVIVGGVRWVGDVQRGRRTSGSSVAASPAVQGPAGCRFHCRIRCGPVLACAAADRDCTHRPGFRNVADP